MSDADEVLRSGSHRPVTFRKVLCGVDASEQSMVAVRQAVALAEEGAKCWALSAWDPGLAMPAGTAALDVMHQLRQESRVFGSVASAMAHYAQCSVLVARESSAGAFPGLIVHANDGSPESLDAAYVAGGLAARYG